MGAQTWTPHACERLAEAQAVVEGAGLAVACAGRVDMLKRGADLAVPALSHAGTWVE